MKYIFSFLILFVPFTVFSVGEVITSFDGSYFVQKDGSVRVTESITYDFGENERHGIERYIPFISNTSGSLEKIKLLDIVVKDGSDDDLKTRTRQEDGALYIRIGDEAEIVTGEKIYNISYTVDHVIKTFDEFGVAREESGISALLNLFKKMRGNAADERSEVRETYDELYWNVTGNGWKTPIGRVTALVEFEEGGISDTRCFHGVTGSTEKCFIEGSFENIAEFGHEGLLPQEGLTFAVRVPGGFIEKPSLQEMIVRFIRENAIIALPFITVLVMLRLYLRQGRDAVSDETIYPQWEIPEELNPIEVGAIIDERTQKDDISSLFVDLAIRGYFTIARIPQEGIFGKDDFLLTRKKEWSHDDLNKHEIIFLEGVFSTLAVPQFSEIISHIKEVKALSAKNNEHREQKDVMREVENVMDHFSEKRDVVRLSELENSFYKNIEKISEDVHEGLVQKGFFTKNPRKVRATYIAIGILGSMGALILGNIFARHYMTVITVGSICLSGALIVLFSFAMPQRTRKGVQAKNAIRGLKVYLSKAEKKMLDFMYKENFKDGPGSGAIEQKKDSATFEKYLPYAMVLGVHEAWSQHFLDVYQGEKPQWYESDGSTNFTAADITKDLTAFTTHANKVTHAKPSSSTGSGFSGGSSGGGSGGGGGGSW